MSEIIANAAAAIGLTPVALLLGTNAMLTAAVGVIYRDCRKDRTALWNHVKELEKRIDGG